MVSIIAFISGICICGGMAFLCCVCVSGGYAYFKVHCDHGSNRKETINVLVESDIHQV